MNKVLYKAFSPQLILSKYGRGGELGDLANPFPFIKISSFSSVGQ
jgi:hypothetical protein